MKLPITHVFFKCFFLKVWVIGLGRSQGPSSQPQALIYKGIFNASTKMAFTQICCHVPYVVPYVVGRPKQGQCEWRPLLTNYFLHCSFFFPLGSCWETLWEVKKHHGNLLRTWWKHFKNTKIQTHQNRLEINF